MTRQDKKIAERTAPDSLLAVSQSQVDSGERPDFGLPDATLTELVRSKAACPCRPTDELWLAIRSSTRVSELLISRNGAADSQAVPGLAGALEASLFARVFIFGLGGLFQWSLSMAREKK